MTAKETKIKEAYESAGVDLDNEVWLDIPNYVGIYKISNFSRIKRLPGTVVRKNGKKYTVKSRILKPVLETNGYLKLVLSYNGIKSKNYIHRLVGCVFIPNPDNKPTINHIDGDKTNNSISNLEWNTYFENNNHAFDTGLNKRGADNHLFGKNGAYCHNSKKVIDTATGIVYDSYTMAAKTLNISRSHFCNMISGKKINVTSFKKHT